MSSGRRKDSVRELRLEGLGLVLLGFVLIVLMGGSFWVGRWYERRLEPTTQASIEEPAFAVPKARPDAVKEAADLDASSGTFDTLGEGGSEAEPQREARDRDRGSDGRGEQAVAPAPTAGREPARPASTPKREIRQARERSGGNYFVQVFAGRDQAGAGELVDRLKAAGYPVRLRTEGDLYKVQVGGYGDAAAARSAANRLQGAGYTGAWVTKTDGATGP